MKTTVVIVAFTVAVIASFSFITINKSEVAKSSNVEALQYEPMSGFALEDKDQF